MFQMNEVFCKAEVLNLITLIKANTLQAHKNVLKENMTKPQISHLWFHCAWPDRTRIHPYHSTLPCYNKAGQDSDHIHWFLFHWIFWPCMLSSYSEFMGDSSWPGMQHGRRELLILWLEIERYSGGHQEKYLRQSACALRMDKKRAHIPRARMQQRTGQKHCLLD